MFSSEFFEILRQILRSWQVVAVTVALVIYMYIVSQVARSYRPKRKKVKVKVKKEKAQTEVPEGEYHEEEMGSSSNDELGLEEA